MKSTGVVQLKISFCNLNYFKYLFDSSDNQKTFDVISVVFKYTPTMVHGYNTSHNIKYELLFIIEITLLTILTQNRNYTYIYKRYHFAFANNLVAYPALQCGTFWMMKL